MEKKNRGKESRLPQRLPLSGGDKERETPRGQENTRSSARSPDRNAKIFHRGKNESRVKKKCAELPNKKVYSSPSIEEKSSKNDILLRRSGQQVKKKKDSQKGVREKRAVKNLR